MEEKRKREEEEEVEEEEDQLLESPIFIFSLSFKFPPASCYYVKYLRVLFVIGYFGRRHYVSLWFAHAVKNSFSTNLKRCYMQPFSAYLAATALSPVYFFWLIQLNFVLDALQLLRKSNTDFNSGFRVSIETLF